MLEICEVQVLGKHYFDRDMMVVYHLQQRV